MNDDKRLIFHIDAYSPATIPMAKLAEYMADFAALLGKENAVHFAGVDAGSTQLLALVEFEDVPKVTARLQDIRRGNPPRDALKIFEQIDKRLANDNATGRILVEGGEGVSPAELLAFPGRNRPKAQSYGPFTQDGNLDGILIAVGGKDDTVPLRLQNGETTYANCGTTRAMARDLGRHLFEPVRVYGTGRWLRETGDTWTLIRFRALRFEVLEKDSLRDTVAALRAVRGSAWKNMADPLAELADLRRDGDDELY
jgi:hypothetical protein